jgi:DNA polymerase/3'-5' exonuclease PolX
MNSCPPDKILNPATKRCVSRTSALGKKLLKAQVNKSPLNKSNGKKIKDMRQSIIRHLTTIKNYEFLQKNVFKGRAYAKVLNQLYNYDKPIENYQDFIDNIEVGSRIALKVKQLIEDGVIKYEEEKIKKDGDFKNQLELKKVYGIGDAKIKELMAKGIKTIEDLKKNTHLLNEKQLIGLQYYLDLDKRIPIEEYKLHKTLLEKDLKKLELTYEFVGSYRRGNTSMGDIDILIKKDAKFVLKRYIDDLKKLGYVKEVLAIGDVKFGGIVKLDDNSPARKLDILICPEEEYYYSLLHFTGSAEFNVGLREYLKSKYGLSLSEHGFKTDVIKIPKMNSEQDFFSFFNLRYVEPSKRKMFFNPQK